MTKISTALPQAPQSAGVFDSLNFWPVCPGCGKRHPEAPRSTIKACDLCVSRHLSRKQWADAENAAAKGDAEPLKVLCERIGVGQGFWRNSRPPSFHDHSLNQHVSKDTWPHSRGLYLWGDIGTHKTHMAMARTVAAARRGYTARIVNWRRMCQEITATWRQRDGETELAVVKGFIKLDYLAIDDLGVGLRDLSDGQQAVATSSTYDVIDARYNGGRLMDVTCNWPLEYIRELFEERTWRRLSKSCAEYCMDEQPQEKVLAATAS